MAPDPRLAFDGYARVANQGHLEAQQKPALAYARGSGVVRDMKQALTALHTVKQQIDSRCCDGLFSICIDSQCDAASSRH